MSPGRHESALARMLLEDLEVPGTLVDDRVKNGDVEDVESVAQRLGLYARVRRQVEEQTSS